MEFSTTIFSAVLLMTSVLNCETHGSIMDADELPIVFWASDPVLPDETVMLMGDSFSIENVRAWKKQGMAEL